MNAKKRNPRITQILTNFTNWNKDVEDFFNAEFAESAKIDISISVELCGLCVRK